MNECINVKAHYDYGNVLWGRNISTELKYREKGRRKYLFIWENVLNVTLTYTTQHQPIPVPNVDTLLSRNLNGIFDKSGGTNIDCGV